MNASGIQRTFAGSGRQESDPGDECVATNVVSGDGGLATAAKIANPGGIAFGAGGALLIADSSCSLWLRVRE